MPWIGRFRLRSNQINELLTAKSPSPDPRASVACDHLSPSLQAGVNRQFALTGELRMWRTHAWYRCCCGRRSTCGGFVSVACSTVGEAPWGTLRAGDVLSKGRGEMEQ